MYQQLGSFSSTLKKVADTVSAISKGYSSVKYGATGKKDSLETLPEVDVTGMRGTNWMLVAGGVAVLGAAFLLSRRKS